MNKIVVPHGAYVVVGDGQKALFLRNEGDEKFPNLRCDREFVDDNPPSREQGTERPGRTFKRADTNQRSAMEPTDWHNLEKHRFARRIAAEMNELIRHHDVKALVVVAPPRTLADLRRAVSDDVKALIVAEVDKDLVKHPIIEIEKMVLAHCAAVSAQQLQA
jgi:protein required for attachment to host cells